MIQESRNSRNKIKKRLRTKPCTAVLCHQDSGNYVKYEGSESPLFCSVGYASILSAVIHSTGYLTH